MSHFNRYIQSHFAGCRLVAEGYDLTRQRDVRVFLIPGYPDDVGTSDGTDAWVIPLAAEGFGALTTILRGISVRDLVKRIFAGEEVPVARAIKAARRRVDLEEAQPQASPRRRLVEEEPQPEAPRRRHVVL